MQFKFDVNEVFRSPLVELNNTLIPSDWTGRRRMLYDTVSKVGEVVNEMGLASAKAQGLSRPLTSSEKLKNSDQKVYLAIDQEANNGRGAVAGLLKTGAKSLYAFDRQGREYKLKAPYLYDFYVPENRQRMGWGKYMYDSMLLKQNIEPVKMAFDIPTDPLMSFLNKHYGMKDPVRQENKFVVFDGFFSSGQTPINPDITDPYEDENEKYPVGKSRAKPKYTLVYPDESEEEMYKSKNLLG